MEIKITGFQFQKFLLIFGIIFLSFISGQCNVFYEFFNEFADISIYIKLISLLFLLLMLLLMVFAVAIGFKINELMHDHAEHKPMGNDKYSPVPHWKKRS